MISIQEKTEYFLTEVKQAVINESLILPSLPDVALKIKTECEKQDSSAQKIAEMIGQDPALSARLLQVANSSMYRTRSSTDNIQMAITKLGLNMVKNLIISLSMKQLYNADSDVIAERFKELWLASVKTAAIAQLLASQQKHLHSEVAMLAGLIHNIGALPIILLAEDDDDLFDQPGLLCEVIKKMQGDVSAYIFQKWNFPEYMTEIANHCYLFQRHHDGPADYIDIVQAALIEGSIYTGLDCPDDWSSISAFNQLGIDTHSHILDIQENKIVFDETTSLFK